MNILLSMTVDAKIIQHYSLLSLARGLEVVS